MATKTILVVGATGKQGGAVVKALLALPARDPPLRILALTRDAESARAQALQAAHKDTIELVQGDTTDPKPIFASRPKGSITAVFSVTTPGKVPEDQQAIPLIDEAVARGVSHIVFSSVDRGGDEKSWSNPTKIKHFYEKHNVELHLRNKAAAEPGKFTWTILRPVAFLDNLYEPFFCKMFLTMWASALRPETKLQLVSVQDIGMFAAKALDDPKAWAGRAVGLAGDAVTLGELKGTWEKVVGRKPPQTFTFLGTAMLWGLREVGLMYSFFEKEGYGADIEARRKEVPLWDLEAYLRETNGFWKK